MNMRTTVHGSRRTAFGVFRTLIAGLACLTGALSGVADDYSFGPGQYSTFNTIDGGSAVVVGVSGI